jgi:hypothetical protein
MIARSVYVEEPLGYNPGEYQGPTLKGVKSQPKNKGSHSLSLHSLTVTTLSDMLYK